MVDIFSAEQKLYKEAATYCKMLLGRLSRARARMIRINTRQPNSKNCTGEGLGKTSLTGVPISNDFQALKKCGKLSRLLEMKKINKLSLARTIFTWSSLHTFGCIPNST